MWRAGYLQNGERYKKFVSDIQKQIDDADKDAREKTEHILDSIADHYDSLLSERIRYELQTAVSDEKAGNIVGANQHRTLAQVFQSILDSRK